MSNNKNNSSSNNKEKINIFKYLSTNGVSVTQIQLVNIEHITNEGLEG
jgi:hypothetical protein